MNFPLLDLTIRDLGLGFDLGLSISFFAFAFYCLSLSLSIFLSFVRTSIFCENLSFLTKRLGEGREGGSGRIKPSAEELVDIVPRFAVSRHAQTCLLQ